MFELYRNDSFVLYYENQNNSSGVTHLLTAKALSTGKTTGMWVDPTGTSTDPGLLDKILRLQELKETLDEEAYTHEVACFIECLIENGGYTCLEISSLMKDVLRHHKDPNHLFETIKNIDVSYIRNEDRERFNNIHEMKNAIAGFIKVLTEFVCNLISIPSEIPLTSILVKFNIYQNHNATDQEELTDSSNLTII